MSILFILLCICIWFLYWLIDTIWKRRQYPPGPFPLPLIGNLHLLMKDIHLAMDGLSNEYGSMFTLWMTNIPYIVVTDMETARKVCSTKKFADRLPLYVGKHVYSRGSKDMIFGDYSKELLHHRKLAASAFRLFGTGTQDCILSSTKELLHTIESRLSDHDYNIAPDLDLATFNVMSSIVLGTKMSHSDVRYQRLHKAIMYMMQSGVTFSLVNFYPLLRYLPNPDLTEMVKIMKERDVVLHEIVQSASKRFCQDAKVTNYVEALLKARYDIEKEQKDPDLNFSQDHLEMNIFDMFLGGVETVSSTLQWSIMYLIKWPEVQQKCHEELEEFHSNNKCLDLITYSDKDQLHYIQATILETLRLASTLPFGVFHKSREDSEINGYPIKKGTSTMINIWSLHHNKDYFPKPLEFQPERFLDEEGHLISTSQQRQFFAFSTGPRECIGQTLAKTELFIVLANLLNKFHFKSSIQNTSLDIYGNTKVTHSPKLYKVFVTKRRSSQIVENLTPNCREES